MEKFFGPNQDQGNLESHLETLRQGHQERFCKNCKKKATSIKPVQYSGYPQMVGSCRYCAVIWINFSNRTNAAANKTENSPVRQNEQYFSMTYQRKITRSGPTRKIAREQKRYLTKL